MLVWLEPALVGKYLVGAAINSLLWQHAWTSGIQHLCATMYNCKLASCFKGVPFVYRQHVLGISIAGYTSNEVQDLPDELRKLSANGEPSTTPKDSPRHRSAYA